MIYSVGRRQLQRQIESLNRNDRIYLWIPSYEDCAECGFDKKSRAATDISCSVCGGTGRVATFATARLSCRVSWTDVGRPRFGGSVTTEELGDATVETRIVHKELLEDVRDVEDAYLEIDGRQLRVMSVDINRVEGRTSVVARCEIIRND